jgi:Flp pilus assembly protein TadD
MAEDKRSRSDDEARALRADAQVTIALNFLRQGRYQKALPVFEALLADEPRNPRALMGLGVALGRLGRFDEALDAVARLREVDPGGGRFYNTRATVYEFMGRLEEAGRDFELAVTLEPENPSHHYNYACFWARQGDVEKVRRHLGEALRLNPGSNAFAATDADFAAFRGEEWFQELVAFKKTEE